MRKLCLAVPGITEFQLVNEFEPVDTQLCTQHLNSQVVGLGSQSATSLDVSLWKGLGAWLELPLRSHDSVEMLCSTCWAAQAQGLAQNPVTRLQGKGRYTTLGSYTLSYC